MPDERPMKHRQDSDVGKYEHERKRKKHNRHRPYDHELEVLKSSKHREPAEVIEIHGSSSDEGEVSDHQSCDASNSPKLVNRHRRKHSRHHAKKHKRSHDNAERPSNEEKDDRVQSKKKHNKKVESRSDDDFKRNRRARNREVEIKQDTERTKLKEDKRHSPNRVKREVSYEENDQEVKTEDTRKRRERSRDRNRNNDSSQKNNGIKEEDNRDISSNRRDNPRKGRNDRQRYKDEDEDFEWGKNQKSEPSTKVDPGEKVKPDFKLSGKLTEDRNTFNGVVIKYSEPPEARMPKKRWRLYQFKGQETLPTLYIHRQSAYLIGRDRKVVDLPVDHPSCSKQHAALQYRLITFERPNGSVGKQIRLYVIDLESANGTFINGGKIESKKYVELMEKDVIKFGFSSREYVLLHEQSKDDELSEEG